MELRVLNYFLTIVREGSINRAAEVLHITQPTLSRQIAQMEEEMGVRLFDRSRRSLVLTEEGMLLRRRAEEILALVDRTESELMLHNNEVEGRIVIGSGEMAAVEDLADAICRFHEKYPKVQFDILTADADGIKEQMDKGLVDIGVFLEPVEVSKYDFIRLENRERWGVLMRADDPLAERKAVTMEDLLNTPLILPRRGGVKSELENWFGSHYEDLDVFFTGNLSTNGAVMVRRGLARSVVIEGCSSFRDPQLFAFRPFDPPLVSNSVIAWRKYQPYQNAVTKFVEELRSSADD